MLSFLAGLVFGGRRRRKFRNLTGTFRDLELVSVARSFPVGA